MKMLTETTPPTLMFEAKMRLSAIRLQLTWEDDDVAFKGLYQKPDWTTWVIKRIDESGLSRKTAILRLCEITMSRVQRCRFRRTSVGTEWDKNILIEELCRDPFYDEEMIVRCYDRPRERKQRMMLRQWYKKSKEGKRARVDALYRVISSSPATFIDLLRDSP